MTVNDYLARRDAAWMGGIYRFLGLSVAHVQQGMTRAERRAAYRARHHVRHRQRDRLRLPARPPGACSPTSRSTARSHAAVIDEADSILIDEARVPLVIAGGDSGDRGLAYVADQVVRGLRAGEHFTIDIGAHNVALTDAGIHAVEVALGCGNLFDERNLPIHTAVAGRAARARAAAPRRRLHREERRHRDGGRVQGPDRAGPPLARRTAHRHRSQGRRGGQVAGHDPGPDHAAAPGRRCTRRSAA